MQPDPFTAGTIVNEHNTFKFIVWAPVKNKVELHLVTPGDELIPMLRDERGYWHVTVAADTTQELRYYYRLDDAVDRPDPASHYQPEGVHGPSQTINHSGYQWQDQQWRGIELKKMVLYELHVGTFTASGTFRDIIARLPELKKLGINALELMPVAQFPGARNWGYDGVYPYAVQDSYGGPMELKEMIDACHQIGIAVIMDVVYNHLGPEGNYLGEFGPYFTARYHTPWGRALNFDDADSQPVRDYFIANALHWFRNYHIDGLRLDAVHAIFDTSAYHFLQELADKVAVFDQNSGRKHYLIAESDLNDPRLIRSPNRGGYGLDAQWCDDFHHSLRTLFTGEQTGYFADYGELSHWVKALQEGYVYSGQYSCHRRRHHGRPAHDIPPDRLVVFSQNHDQIGNQMTGERLSGKISFAAQKLMAAAVLLSPTIPMLFMGEEYAETAPFLYFVSHGDPELIAAVRKGRKEEFKTFQWSGEPPDPQDEATYLKSKLDWNQRRHGNHRIMWNFYRKLLAIRKRLPAAAKRDDPSIKVISVGNRNPVIIYRGSRKQRWLILYNFSPEIVDFTVAEKFSAGEKIFDTSAPAWNGPGTLLPDTINQEQTYTLNALGCAVYRLRT